MGNSYMNRQLGTKWFTFYTKVRPWLVCVTGLVTIADFIQYQDVYLSFWWMIIYFLSSITQSVLSVFVFIKSKGHYGNFVRFIKGVLLFEVINFAYGQAVQNYLQTDFSLGVAIVTGAISCIIGLFVWYYLNMIYFKKRLCTTTYSSPVEVVKQDATPPKIGFCRKCGDPLLYNSRFCSKCGTEIMGISAVDNGNGIE